MTCHWYYDLTDDHRHSGDEESQLVWLCPDCARRLRDNVQFAGSDDLLHDLPCWECGQTGTRQPTM